MSDIVITENGKIRRFRDVELVEDIFKIKNTKSHWEVIEKLIQTWQKKTPEDIEALKINLSQYKESLVDKEFGQTAGGKDQERRFTLIFPVQLQTMIRSIYKVDELPFDKEFYNEFATRYPGFRVSEK